MTESLVYGSAHGVKHVAQPGCSWTCERPASNDRIKRQQMYDRMSICTAQELGLYSWPTKLIAMLQACDETVERHLLSDVHESQDCGTSVGVGRSVRKSPV